MQQRPKCQNSVFCASVSPGEMGKWSGYVCAGGNASRKPQLGRTTYRTLGTWKDVQRSAAGNFCRVGKIAGTVLQTNKLVGEAIVQPLDNIDRIRNSRVLREVIEIEGKSLLPTRATIVATNSVSPSESIPL